MVIGSVSATVPPISAGLTASQNALAALQRLPAQNAQAAKVAAEARLQQLIATYRKLALVGDTHILAWLAKQIGLAAKALGDSAAASGIVAPVTPSDSAVLANQTGSAAQALPQADAPDVDLLRTAGDVVRTIRQQIFVVARRHPGQALHDVDTALGDIADALQSVGAVGTRATVGILTAALNLLA